MIGIIVDNQEHKQQQIGLLLEQGYSETEYADLWVRGNEEATIILRGDLHNKETLFLSFRPVVACQLTDLERKIVDFINLRDLSTISLQTNPNEPILSQLWT